MDNKAPKSAQLNHLLPACIALAAAVLLLAAGTLYARRLEAASIHSVAAGVTEQMTIGEAFIKEAVRQPDLLLVIGSSELLAENGPYQANQFFQSYPTGFNTFVVARAGLTSLNMAQDVASAGADLRGKKVVISFTPSMFSPEAATEGTYPGNFSRLHALELVFDARLSWELKRDIAHRMLDFPETLDKDPILRTGVQMLSNGSRRQRFVYFAVWPLGVAETWVLRLQDHWEAVSYLWQHPELKDAPLPQPATIDWKADLVQAEAVTAANATNNPFGFDNQVFLRKYGQVDPQMEPGSGDRSFTTKLKASPEWVDLDLLLRTLREMGADTLVLSRPYSGLYYNYYGISIKARAVYYSTLRNETNSYGIRLVDLSEYDMKKYFNRDATSHTSPLGWVYVNQALDAFFHEKTP